MKIIEITFEGYPKRYAYLLNNPGGFSICKTKPLLYAYGCDTKSIKKQRLNISRIYDMEELPGYITSQITIIDNRRNIAIDSVGAVRDIEIPHKEITPKKKEAELLEVVPKKEEETRARIRVMAVRDFCRMFR